MNVTIIGTGYVGLTTGVALAYLGHIVTCVDNDATKLDLLERGKSPIHEPWLEEFMALARSRMRFVGNTPQAVKEAELIMIAVGTPPKENGEADTRYVEEAAREVAQGLMPGRDYTIVVKSTVPIGSNRRVAHVIRHSLADRKLDTRVYFASNPEFLREGFALADTLFPDRIVVGSESSEAVECLHRLYRPILEQTFAPADFLPRPEHTKLPPLVVTDPTSSEMIKYAANAFLALKISFTNEIAGLCERVGADITEVARGIGLDSRIGPRFLGAGIGWGGSCFPKDSLALLAVGSEHGFSMPIVEAAREVNARQRLVVIEKLQSVLKVLRGRTIGVLGLAFKPDTDDVREAPALEIITRLVELGAHVKAHDPIAISNARNYLGNTPCEYASDPYDLASGCDAVILATEWKNYRQLDLERFASIMRTPVLVDGRNQFDPTSARNAGFTYMGIGR